MTAQHLADALMRASKAHSYRKCATWLGVDEATFFRMYSGGQSGLRVNTLDQIHRRSGIPLDRLMSWYRLPNGASLKDACECLHKQVVVYEAMNRVECTDCNERLDPVDVLVQLIQGAARHRDLRVG